MQWFATLALVSARVKSLCNTQNMPRHAACVTVLRRWLSFRRLIPRKVSCPRCTIHIVWAQITENVKKHRRLAASIVQEHTRSDIAMPQVNQEGRGRPARKRGIPSKPSGGGKKKRKKGASTGQASRFVSFVSFALSR